MFVSMLSGLVDSRPEEQIQKSPMVLGSTPTEIKHFNSLCSTSFWIIQMKRLKNWLEFWYLRIILVILLKTYKGSYPYFLTLVRAIYGITLKRLVNVKSTVRGMFFSIDLSGKSDK